MNIRPQFINTRIGRLFVFYFASLLVALIDSRAGEFAVYDLFLDPEGEPLAAYQVKIEDKNAAIKIISVEGGEHSSFQKAPYFDPKAIQQDVIKIAGFSTSKRQDLPTTRTRIASLHVEIGPEQTPNLVTTIEAASRPGGAKLRLKATLVRRILP